MFERGFDQAQGLRRLFARRTVQLVPVLSNPHAPGACRLLDGLCQAFAAQGQRTLLVDAETAPVRGAGHLAAEIAGGGTLQSWMERIDAHTTLMAVGEALRSFSGRAEADVLFGALAQHGGGPDVILFHADALTLSGLFAQRPVRSLALSSDSVASLTHAYAGLKLLVCNGALRHHALLMDASTPQCGPSPAARRLQQCAADFLRARVECAAVVCSRADGDAQLARTLRQVSFGLLQFALPWVLPEQGQAPWQPSQAVAQPSGCVLNF